MKSGFFRFPESRYKLPDGRGGDLGCALQLINWSFGYLVYRDGRVPTKNFLAFLQTITYSSTVKLLYKLLGHR